MQVQPFELAEYCGEVATPWQAEDLESALAPVLDVGQAEEILHWGRNILWTAKWPTAEGGSTVVVKQFRHEDLRRRLDRRWRGSKAARNWRAALALQDAGIAVPAPVAWVESRQASGPAFFICGYLPHRLEARYPLRALNADRLDEEFPAWPRQRLLEVLAGTARRLHAAGFWHRDYSAGNVLLPDGPAEGGDEAVLVDLNRTRRLARLGRAHRLDDLSRMPIVALEDRRALLKAYLERPPTPSEWWSYRWRYLRFHGRHRLKKAWRRRTAGWKNLLVARKAYPHLPPPEEHASRRDRVVWDRLSDQPHQHASRWDKLTVRVRDVGAHVRTVGAVVTSAPRIWRRYRKLRQGLYRAPTRFDGIGVCLRPLPGQEAALLSAVEGLGVHHLLLRLHPWQSDHEAELQLAQELASRGYDLVFALPQRRELVRDPARWRAAVEELAERFTPYGKTFQLGQAINRSKWGVWNYAEFQAMARSAAEILRRNPEVRVVGPGVIDFELHATAAVVNWPGRAVTFDALASLLYVDRRGAPENPQAGFDTVGKVLLAQAIAETARHCGPRSWVTEVNWPLREGPHSPAGRDVSVDEETYADYLARYYLLALATGCVERVYWWQLEARGYGLAVLEGDTLRLRPGYQALATLAERLRGWTFQSPLEGPPGTYLYPFEREGDRRLAAWSGVGVREVELPAPVRRAVDRSGTELPVSGSRVTIDGSVRYFDL